MSGLFSFSMTKFFMFDANSADPYHTQQSTASNGVDNVCIGPLFGTRGIQEGIKKHTFYNNSILS